MRGQGCVERSDVLLRLAKSLIVADDQELRDVAAQVLAHQIVRQRFRPQLAQFLSPAEVQSLLSQGEALGLREQVLSAARAWRTQMP
jgi:hypothetical protein